MTCETIHLPRLGFSYPLLTLLSRNSYGYQLQGSGRWISLNLKKKKKAGGGKRSKRPAATPAAAPNPNSDDEETEQNAEPMDVDSTPPPPPRKEEEDPDDPEKSVPSSRYNAMLAVQRNTLYLYVVWLRLKPCSFCSSFSPPESRLC
jgi:hypothetical protein